MKLICIIFCTCFYSFGVSAQSQTTIYFDKDWKETYKSNAAFYREINFDYLGNPSGKIKDYFINGSLQWEGTFLSKNYTCSDAETCRFDGVCIWYYKNGRKNSEGLYRNGKSFGKVTNWDENGNVLDLDKIFSQAILSEKILKGLIEDNIKKSEYDPLEGIWSGAEEMQIFIDKNVLPSKVILKRLGIVKIDNSYLIIEIDKGDYGLELNPTSTKGEYRASNHSFKGTGRLLDLNTIKVVMQANTNSIIQMLGGQYRDLIDVTEVFIEMNFNKDYPTSYDFERAREKAIEEAPRSGTGFALSTDGFIATNYHVIENSKSIKIRGIKGDFTNSFIARVIKTDQSTDLAILKIDDPLFHDLGNVPFTIVSSKVDVGEDVFALGYPLMTTMGEEIKLTTGIVSANSGFQGNSNQYQISVPVQPGNSGGPLFDKNGRIVGIVNARHLNTDNVSYAIKSGNLLGLFYMIPETSVLDASLMTGKSLPDMVKQAKNFVYIIEVNK